MFDTVTHPATQLVAARSDTAHELTRVSLAAHSDAELLELLRVSEQARRREAVFDQALLAELSQRTVAPRVGYKSMAALLHDMLRISPAEATTRLHAAKVAGPRVALSGEQLDPALAVTAAAQAEGQLSPGHVRVIAQVLDKIPAAQRAEYSTPVEESLVHHAGRYDPTTLAIVGRRLIDLLDPDGTLSDDADRARHRELTLLIHPDGTGTLRGTTDAHLTELLAVVFDSLASPKNRDLPVSGPGADDPAATDLRTPAQRRHDAMITALRPVVASGQLPPAGGVAATVLLTATAEQWQSGEGLVRTGHGALITVATAQRIAGGDAQLAPIVFGRAKEVVAYGTAQRIFTKAQRLAIFARDRGCTWPGCDRPASQCEINHVTPWAISRRTTVDDGALLCTGDHPNLDHNGWTATMINGRPHYIPPPWIDPQQRPRRNTLHDPIDTN